jgi:hypothetical protein
MSNSLKLGDGVEPILEQVMEADQRKLSGVDVPSDASDEVLAEKAADVRKAIKEGVIQL